MEYWQEETLRYFWKRMKIESCINKEYYDPYMRLCRSYSFPNGVFVKCRYGRYDQLYLSIAFRTGRQVADIISGLMGNRDYSRDEFGWGFEFSTQISTQGSLIELLWNLYSLDANAGVKPTAYDERTLECPHCKAKISYDAAKEPITIRCRNCGYEFFSSAEATTDAEN